MSVEDFIDEIITNIEPLAILVAVVIAISGMIVTDRALESMDIKSVWIEFVVWILMSLFWLTIGIVASSYIHHIF